MFIGPFNNITVMKSRIPSKRKKAGDNRLKRIKNKTFFVMLLPQAWQQSPVLRQNTIVGVSVQESYQSLSADTKN